MIFQHLSFDVVFAEFKVNFHTQQRMLNILKTIQNLYNVEELVLNNAIQCKNKKQKTVTIYLNEKLYSTFYE